MSNTAGLTIEISFQTGQGNGLNEPVKFDKRYILTDLTVDK